MFIKLFAIPSILTIRFQTTFPQKGSDAHLLTIVTIISYNKLHGFETLKFIFSL